MTHQKDFKQLVRARMKKTGERYTAARAALIGTRSAGAAKTPSLFPGYTGTGGICRDTGALRNFLEASGLRAAHSGEPLSEAMAFGLCGGVGFLYAVFEYKGWPPILSVLTRHDTMPDSFIAGGLLRLGVKIEVAETSSAGQAARSLAAALDARRPALCVVDCLGMARAESTSPLQMSGAPTVVGVAGVDGEDLLLDDGGIDPRRMSKETFARARALYKKGKHRLVTMAAPGAPVAIEPMLNPVIAATADRFHNSPYKGFAANFGFAGLDKWRGLMTDAKDKKGWPQLFPEGKLAYFGLRRTHDGIETEFTAPAAGRPLYADFLREAATITGNDRLRSAAELFRLSGEHWSAISTAIAGCGDEAIEAGCRLGESAQEIIDEAGCPRAAELQALGEMRQSLAEQCRMTRDEARNLYADLSSEVAAILALETEAVAILAPQVARRN